MDQQDSHHVLGAAVGGNVEDAVLADVALCWVPAHLEGAGGRIRHLQVLHSSQRLCWKQTTQNGHLGWLQRLGTSPSVVLVKICWLRWCMCGLQTRVGAFTRFSIG